MSGTTELPTPSTPCERPAPHDTETSTASAVGDETERRALAEKLPRGTQVGRYLVIEPLASGGMGVVYRAHDPKLDRQIALKLLRISTGVPDASTQRARERLLREAQALAQLTHPNVVAAYDVGTFDDNVFVAMELVDGVTLKEWLRQGHSTPEIVDVMLAAGRGLAAAHAAGLVHRDIKPSNILVGHDGRAQVADFGLARPVHGSEDAHAPAGCISSGSTEDDLLGSSERRLSAPLTMAGALVGTPGYIAPELYQLEQAGELSDQYSFAVTLYEALYGKRPFDARSPHALRDKVLIGELSPPPAGSKLPARLRRIVLRGMAVDPGDRYPSMTALLGDLGRAPWARARRAATWTALLGLSALAITLGVTRGHRVHPCAAEPDAFRGICDPAVRRAIGEVFESTGRPYAHDTWERISRAIDDRVDDWSKMRVATCEATVVRREQSAALMDRRMACLDRRRDELGALTQVFREHADGEVVDNAVDAVYALPSLSRCTESETLLAAPLPADPAVAAEVTAARLELTRARALRQAGKYGPGLERAAPIPAIARRIDDPPLLAEAVLEVGWLQLRLGKLDPAETAFADALDAAAAAGDDRLMAEAASALVYLSGNQRRAYDRALAEARMARALIKRAGDPPEMRSDLLADLGFVLSNTPRAGEAADTLREALALAERANGPTHPRVAHVLNQLGFDAIRRGDLDEARADLERALAIWEQTLGANHPKVGIALNNLGQIYMELGDIDHARSNFERALAIYVGALGPSHTKVAIATNNLAEALASQGHCDEALPRFQRAYDIWHDNHLPADHPYYAAALTGTGRCLVDLGRPGEAVEPLEHALAIRADGGSATDRGTTELALGQALWASGGDRKRARALVRFARDHLSGDRHQSVADRWLADHGGN